MILGELDRETGQKRLNGTNVFYSSKIIKAGALIGDTKIFLFNWDVSVSVTVNMKRMQRENLFGKASRSRVKEVLAILRQRHLTEECVTRALVLFVQGRFSSVALERIFTFIRLERIGYFLMLLPRLYYPCTNEA